MSAVRDRAGKVGLLTLALTAVLVAGWFVLRDGLGPKRVAPGVPAPVVERLGPAPEDEAAAREYAKMIEEQKYNAAFATNPNGGYGFAFTFARIEDAERFALAHCEAFGPECRIVLRIVPDTPVEIDGQLLSRAAALGLAEYVTRDRPKAIALTGHGGWGASYGRRSKRAAIEAALSNCGKHEVTQGGGIEMTSKCRVIWAD